MVKKIKVSKKKLTTGDEVLQLISIEHTRSIKSKSGEKLGSFIKPITGIQKLFLNRTKFLKLLGQGVHFTPLARKLLDSEIKLLLSQDQHVITKQIKRNFNFKK